MKNKNKPNSSQQPHPGGRRNASSFISVSSHLFCIAPRCTFVGLAALNACGVWECEKRLHFKGQRLGEGKIENLHHVPVVSL